MRPCARKSGAKVRNLFYMAIVFLWLFFGLTAKMRFWVKKWAWRRELLGMNEKKCGKNFAVTFICAKFAADLGTTPRNQFLTRNGFLLKRGCHRAWTECMDWVLHLYYIMCMNFCLEAKQSCQPHLPNIKQNIDWWTVKQLYRKRAWRKFRR